MHVSKGVKAVALALVACLMLSMTSFTATCERLSSHVVRLHVLAASDSVEDQAVKLQVRDAVLRETDGLLTGVKDEKTAWLLLSRKLKDIEHAANQCLQASGSEDTAKVSLCDRVYFPTRCYETVTFPAGEYAALRVVIGEGEGRNWWCVAFPPMCLSGACDTDSLDILSPSERRLIEEPSRYRVRWKIVEWINGFRHAADL